MLTPPGVLLLLLDLSTAAELVGHDDAHWGLWPIGLAVSERLVRNHLWLDEVIAIPETSIIVFPEFRILHRCKVSML
jgi:hypothetical protein